MEGKGIRGREGRASGERGGREGKGEGVQREIKEGERSVPRQLILDCAPCFSSTSFTYTFTHFATS